jgi:4-hydroxy-tetrahydrodipicolinate reductase
MNIALIGYGKMGKIIEKITLERGHTISCIIDKDEDWKLLSNNSIPTDVAIDFSTPSTVVKNIKECFAKEIPIVVGTTGWQSEIDILKSLCTQENKSLLWASNFSVGVNIFFKINEELAKRMNQYPQYDVSMEETHHTAKLDAPSGTALSLADTIIKHIDRKKTWVLGESKPTDSLSIQAHRIDPIPGTHRILYDSDIDNIEIIHTAKNRNGFAIGAVIGAEWLVNHKGWHEFKDIFF